MILFVGSAVLCFIVWAVLVFILAIPSGWIHLPLAAGCVLLARALVGRGQR